MDSSSNKSLSHTVNVLQSKMMKMAFAEAFAYLWANPSWGRIPSRGPTTIAKSTLQAMKVPNLICQYLLSSNSRCTDPCMVIKDTIIRVQVNVLPLVVGTMHLIHLNVNLMTLVHLSHPRPNSLSPSGAKRAS